MSLHIHRPQRDQATQPARVEQAPLFNTATFHETRPRSLRDLIDITPQQSPAAAAWDRANAPAGIAAAEAAAEARPPKSNWRRHIGDARLAWNKLSGGELERVDGDQAKLVQLLLRHYSVDRHEASRLVRNFFERNRIS